MVGREYLNCAAFLLSNLFTCQGKPVTGNISVKATCHQLWHTTFSLTGLCEKTTIAGSTCALDSSVDTHLATALCHCQGGPLNAQYSAKKKTHTYKTRAVDEERLRKVRNKDSERQ
jgi:hypothetical protein